ncbi:hypothetical protein [Pseudoalteromonas luteoviolacea]|uniref:Uncharacterized protein n=1 Tax=Pseudoalteromonas luteoviolacea DSM 6061 TaxID=1365250 RepID=A0A166XZ80_9GAMM|nr:hypothetical protein [Pseudoalteromonas luteoviolacea]KZN41064.1 hypothetical protein N475_10855 [Pseudoalteromonas luteoviolacea DSM 6061]MBE0389858.1 hypothetical protein [Pseudoalteromonas luteoviolacea DSM 6061]TQF67572.1 hypothetical protein FLM44_20535 [Pseudoalteromonas luteoviolacea]
MQSVVELYASVAYRLLDFVVVLSAVFIAIGIKKRGARIFFNTRYKLEGKDEHDYVSWSFTLLVFALFNYIDTAITASIISLDTDYLLRRKLFYLSKVFFFLLLYLSLYALHAMRSCSFSATARIAYYLGLIPITLYMFQLISRGYYDVTLISSVYFKLMISIYASLACVLYTYYPIKSMYKMWQNRSERINAKT